MASRMLVSAVFPRIGRPWTLWKPAESEHGGSASSDGNTTVLQLPSIQSTQSKQDETEEEDGRDRLLQRGGSTMRGVALMKLWKCPWSAVLGTLNVPGKLTRGLGT
jgi:hypothetical protein